jgi:hypothetical protein
MPLRPRRPGHAGMALCAPLEHDVLMRIQRRPFGDLTVTKRLSVLFGVLALGWLIAGIYGAVTAKAGLVGFGFGAALFFGVGAWWLSPQRIRRSAQR